MLLTSGIHFIFSLGISTNISNLIYAKIYDIDGAEIFDEIQPFNRQLVLISIIMILLSVFLFITKTNNRRKYYISNYISIGLSAIFNISSSIWGLRNIFTFRNRFLTEVDFDTWFQFHESDPLFPYSDSTFFLDITIATNILVILVSIILLGNLMWKIKLMKYENLLLGKVKTDHQISIAQMKNQKDTLDHQTSIAQMKNPKDTQDHQISIAQMKYISIDKMKYRKDTLSYSLTLLGLFANALYFITLYKNNGNFYYSYVMGISVIYNLIFMLMVFLSAEEIKVYKRPFSIVLFIIGIFQLVRILIYPKFALEAEAISQQTHRMLIIYIIISSA